MGSVKIKTHDGSVRILLNVRHVPKLKRNLSLLGCLMTMAIARKVRRVS